MMNWVWIIKMLTGGRYRHDTAMREDQYIKMVPGR